MAAALTRFPTRQIAPESAPDCYNLEAEKAIIGSILLNRDAVIAIKDWFVPQDCYLASHQYIVSAALDLANAATPPDTIAVMERLRQRGQLEAVGGITTLTECMQSVPTSYHIEHYAHIVMRLSWQRQAQHQASRMVSGLYAPDCNPNEQLNQLEAWVSDLRKNLRSRSTLRTFALDELWAQYHPPLGEVAQGIVYEGLTLLSGKPKMGKSLITIDLAAAIASGQPTLHNAPTIQGDVLYLGLEDSEATLQERFEAAFGGRPVGVAIEYRTDWPKSDAGGIEAIDGWLAMHPNARLVVIDTLARIAPKPDARNSGYQADYDSLEPLHRIASTHPGLAIIVVTHSRKASADDVLDEVSGTTGKTGAVDHVMVMRRVRGEMQAELHIHPRRAASSERVITFDPMTATWSLGGDLRTVRASGMRQDIVEALAVEAMWPKDIAESVDCDRAHVRKALASMKRQGLIESNDQGRYKLTAQGRDLASDPTPDPTKNERSAGSADQGSDLTHSSRSMRGFDSPISDQLVVDQGLIPDPADPADPHKNNGSGMDQADALDRLLKRVPPRERFYVRMYLRSEKDSDQRTARVKLDRYGLNYAAAYQALHGREPPELME